MALAKTNPFAHATGELAGHLVLHPPAGPPWPTFPTLLAHLLLREAVVCSLRGEGHVVQNGHGVEQGRLLEEHAETPPHLIKLVVAHAHDVAAAHQHPA